MSGVKDSTKKEALQARVYLPSFIQGQALEMTQVCFRTKGTAVGVGAVQPDLEFSLFLPTSFKVDKTKQNNILQTILSNQLHLQQLAISQGIFFPFSFDALRLTTFTEWGTRLSVPGGKAAFKSNCIAL